MDNRLKIFCERLDCLSTEEIQRIKDNINMVCFDTFNYDEKKNKFCPLAIALNLHKTISNPTDILIREEINKRFHPVNTLKGVKGFFYTNRRKEDLLEICNLMINVKNLTSII